MYEKKLKGVKFLVGNRNIASVSTDPYNRIICKFLVQISLELKKKKYNQYPDLLSLSFWCRKKNIERLKKNFAPNDIRKGRGLIFHVAPSNVPTNFIYSLIFGLLTGNSNIVKVPSKKFNQITIICEILNKLLKKKIFYNLKKLVSIVRFDKENYDAMAYLSNLCDVRIIWGGDNSINEIRKFPLNERSLELTFADRYSICLINSFELKKINQLELKTLVKNFYNDTYLFDQNACSSPHLLLWTGKFIKTSRKRFWLELNELLKKKYLLPDKAAFEKINKLFLDILNLKNIKFYEKYDSKICTIFLSKLDSKTDRLRGKWGYFYEYELKKLEYLKKIINKKYQTLTYFGIKKNILNSFVLSNVKGIDRVVPIGQASDINLKWDGFDINYFLTRVIDVK